MNTTEIRELTDADLDLVSGGDSNYKECPYGTKAGGPAGMYPWYADCNPGPGKSYGSGDLAKDLGAAMGGIR